MLTPWKKSYGKSRQHIEKQRHHFGNKVPSSESYGFSSSHVQMWELDHKEGWVLKNWIFQTVVLEKTLESPLDSKQITPVNPKGNQHWILIGLTDAEAPTLATWCKEPTHWKRFWCWARLKAGREGDDGGWDGWMASLTQRIWVWVNSGRWRAGKPVVLQSTGLQRFRHDWVTDQQQ